MKPAVPRRILQDAPHVRVIVRRSPRGGCSGEWSCYQKQQAILRKSSCALITGRAECPCDQQPGAHVAHPDLRTQSGSSDHPSAANAPDGRACGARDGPGCGSGYRCWRTSELRKLHLRQLAKHGLIEENPERVENGRERWWRMSSERGFEIDLDAMRQREGGEVAADILRQVGQGHVLALYRAIHEFPGRDAPRDQRRTINDDFAVRLSDTELQEMRRDLADLLDRWTDASRAIADADDGQERHAYYGIVMGALVQDIGATASAPRED